MLSRSRFLALALLAGSLTCAFAQNDTVTRKWTNDAGTVIDAELGAYDGTTVTLLMNGKEFNVPVEKLSAADRDWLANWKKENEERMASLVGLRQDAPITGRYGKTTDDYFQFPKGKDVRKFYDTVTSICDDTKKGLFMNCEESVAWERQTMLVYCPPNYRGEETPMGVYINISAGAKPIRLVDGYDKVMERRKMIYVSPSGTSNSQSDVRRMVLALDSLATLKKDYKIDADRIFVGGVSGGGAMSTWMTIYRPEIRGAICQVRNHYIPSQGCFPTVEEGDIREITRRKQAYAWVTGPKDFNYKAILKSTPTWEPKGFIAKLFDVPGMAHQSAPAEALEEALTWAEESSSPPKH